MREINKATIALPELNSRELTEINGGGLGCELGKFLARSLKTLVRSGAGAPGAVYAANWELSKHI